MKCDGVSSRNMFHIFSRPRAFAALPELTMESASRKQSAKARWKIDCAFANFPIRSESASRKLVALLL